MSEVLAKNLETKNAQNVKEAYPDGGKHVENRVQNLRKEMCYPTPLLIRSTYW